jgi:hypothetical protein
MKVRSSDRLTPSASARKERHVKALSVRAPWWWAILHGKPVENRDWYTNFRGTVWLHASKAWKIGEISDDWDDIKIMAIRDKIVMPFPSGTDESMKFAEGMRSAGGCIVGSVEIIDCVTEHPSAFFVGKFGFVLRNPMPLANPVPLKGALGFFEVPDGLISDAA